MTNFKSKWQAAAALLSAAALCGCQNSQSSASSTPMAPQATNFSAFAMEIFSASADTAPVNLNGVEFNFDVDNDPTAFDGLLM